MKKEKQPESLLMEKFDVRELIRKFWITEVKTLLPYSIGNKFVSLYFQKWAYYILFIIAESSRNTVCTQFWKLALHDVTDCIVLGPHLNMCDV